MIDLPEAARDQDRRAARQPPSDLHFAGQTQHFAETVRYAPARPAKAFAQKLYSIECSFYPAVRPNSSSGPSAGVRRTVTVMQLFRHFCRLKVH